MASLRSIIAAGTVLLGTSEASSLPSPSRPKDSLSTVLLRRLESFAAAANAQQWQLKTYPAETPGVTPSQVELKGMTADYAADVLNLISLQLDDNSAQPAASTSKAPVIPVFGQVDIKVISTLAGIIGRWGLANRVDEGIIPPSLGDIARGVGVSRAGVAKISEIVEREEDEQAQQARRQKLGWLVKAVLDVVMLHQDNRGSAKAQLAAIILPQLLPHLLGALVQLVYSGNSEPWASTALEYLVSRTPPVVIISHLLMLLSAGTTRNPWLRPTLSTLLTQRLVAEGGVRSLFIVVVGEDDNLSTQKLNMLGKLIRAGLVGPKRPAYLKNMVEQLLAIVQRAAHASLPTFVASHGKSVSRTLPAPPVSITQATCFVLSDLIDRYSAEMETSLYSRLFSTLLPSRYTPVAVSIVDPSDLEALDPIVASTSQLYSALAIVSTIILHAPPSPHLFPFILRPITPVLFSLTSYLTTSKADPRMLEEIAAILETWGKAAPLDDVIRGVVKAVEIVERGEEFGAEMGEGMEEFYFARSEEGSICIRLRLPTVGGQEDPTKLRLDPEGIVAWLQQVGRKDLSGSVFLRWLDEVQMLKSAAGIEAAKRSVVRLQLVLRMVDEFGSELLDQPRQIVAFIAHALPADAVQKQEAPIQVAAKPGLGLDDLHIVDPEQNGAENEEDEEDDEALLPGSGVDEITMTALTLLLAVLEANRSLSMTSDPLLSIIFAKLEPLVDGNSHVVAPIAREARLILSLRQASTLGVPTMINKETDPLAASRERYQEALMLMQDSILPVRAQGLAILRSLVASKAALLSTDPALIPAVLDIFIQAIEDEDSFLYLNAVEGLSCMVDSYGKQIVRRLVEVYLGGRKRTVEDVGQGEKGRRELDKRLRIGETLVRVVERAGEAFAIFVDDLIPSLLLVLRTSTLPVPLRSSTLTILATSIETAPVALLQYADSLTETCLTLLSLESRPLQPRRAAPGPLAAVQDFDSGSEEDITPLDRKGQPKRPEETPDPVSTNSKHPVLRRAAILFLGLLFRVAAIMASDEQEAVERAHHYDSHNPLPNFMLAGRTPARSKTSRVLISLEQSRRAKIVLRYVGETDEDSLVRHQARAVLEEII